MAAVTITSGYPKMENMGSVTMYIYRLTAITDTYTLATGIGARFIDHWVRWNGNPGTQTSACGNTSESDGTITFYPGTDALGATVFVIARGN